jgi:hypothetical protein
MKKLHSLPYLVIFLANLLAGFLAGSKVLPEKAGKTYPIIEGASGMDSSVPALANGQRSILLVTVDKLEARKPRLTGVWAVLYVPGNPHLTLLPIYPVLTGQDSGDELANRFGIQQDGSTLRLDQTFTKQIQEYIPWWSGYLLLDQEAVSGIVDYWVNSPGTNRTSIDTMKQSGNKAFSDLPYAWEDPFSALYSQASLYQELCWGMAWSETGFEVSQAREHISLIKNHFSTDLDPLLILNEIKNLRGLSGSLVCEFPTLSVQARIVK